MGSPYDARADIAAKQVNDESAPPDIEMPPLEAYEADFPDGGASDKAERQSIEARPFEWVEPTAVPPRQWIYRRHYQRGMVGATAAIAGAGKSSLLNVELVSLAIGRDLLDGGREIPLGPMTVWGHNGEDPYEELQRRILAVCQHYGVTREDLGGRLRITSGRDMPITVAVELMEGRMLRPTEDGRDIAAEIKKHTIQVICLDPFVTVHRVPENDNGLMDGVMTILRDVAHETQCAVEVAHHFRKLNGEDASIDAVRGAGALIGACRSVRIISSMSRDEAAKYGIDDEQRGFYSWLQNGKANMLPPTHRRRWIFMASVDLRNGSGPHASDEIGVATSWEPPDAADDLTPPEFRAIRRAIQDANPLQALRFDIRSKGWIGYLLARTLDLDEDDKIVRQRMKSIVERFLHLGYVKKEEVRDHASGRNTMAVIWQKGGSEE